MIASHARGLLRSRTSLCDGSADLAKFNKRTITIVQLANFSCAPRGNLQSARIFPSNYDRTSSAQASVPGPDELQLREWKLPDIRLNPDREGSPAIVHDTLLSPRRHGIPPSQLHTYSQSRCSKTRIQSLRTAPSPPLCVQGHTGVMDGTPCFPLSKAGGSHQ